MQFREFALREDAFARVCDRRFIFPCKSLRHVQGRILHHIRIGNGALVVVGGAGVGKTTALRRLAENLAAKTWTVHWHDPLVTRDPVRGDPILDGTMDSGGLGGPAPKNGRKAVFVDAADDLPETLLKDVWGPSRVGPRDVLLLAGTETLVEKLACAPHDFAFRLVRMRPLQYDEIAAYVRHRLKVAGSTSPDVFTQDALDLLADISRGVPGTINRLAVAAMLLAKIESRRRVDADLVSEAAEDLGLSRQADALEMPAAAELPEQLSPSERPQVFASQHDDHPLPPEVLPSDVGADQAERGVEGAGAPELQLFTGRSRTLWAALSAAAAMVVALVWYAADQGPGAPRASGTYVASSGAAPASPATPETAPDAGKATHDDGSAGKAQDASEDDQGAQPPGPPRSTSVSSDDPAATIGPDLLPGMPVAELAAGIAKGDELLALGDIASARLYYELAMRHGSPEAARKLARSYDPLFLQRERVSGLRGDVTTAITIYRAAADLGDPEAATRLSALLDGAEAPRSE